MARKSNKKTSSKKTKSPKISYLYKPEDMSLEAWQVALRQQAAQKENFGIRCMDIKRCPGEYLVHNPKKQNDYKVVYRGLHSEWNYCSCMDFKTSRLGTCKHIEAVRLWLGGRNDFVHRETPPYTSVYLSYRGERKVKIRIGTDNSEEYKQLAADYFDQDGVLMENHYLDFPQFVAAAHAVNNTFRCYKDAVDFIVDKREQERRAAMAATYTDEMLDHLLKVRLYPYQKEGIRFATRAGKCIIADEMGLGKTIQAIGTAELLRKEGLISSVLILCPTSLKYQWRSEIKKFTDAEVTVIEGIHTKRRMAYQGSAAYKIISYNSACNDIKVMGSLHTDMLVMDEVQRLKNWNTQISMAARKIEADYSVVLSGTPLENKLDELYSIVEFVDQFRLAPYYLFRENHVVTDGETGKVVGYRNLNTIGEALKDILIRRRKRDVRLQMPERMDKTLFVPMTQEQKEMHNEWKHQVGILVRRWKRMHFLSDKDRTRLLMFLSQMRMVCDSTFILDQQTRYDTKVDEVVNIVSDIVSEDGEKVVVFSQWERMTRLVAQELEKKGIGFEYLHGGVPSVKRKDMVDNFATLPECRVFLSTDAGCTGLNLQSAATIINIDLPWNPAVLEQRIGRIYRLGQRNNIQVINLVTPYSIEEEMLDKLRFKSSMFEGVLDNGADTVFIGKDKFAEMMDTFSELVDTDQQTEEDTDVTIADTEEAKTVDEEEQERETDMEMPEEQPSSHLAQSKPADNLPPADSTTESTVPSNASKGHMPRPPKELVSQGISFLSGLTETLKSPEATAQLVDAIVETDEDTRETSIKIPVQDKETVANLFNLLGRFLSSH